MQPLMVGLDQDWITVSPMAMFAWVGFLATGQLCSVCQCMRVRFMQCYASMTLCGVCISWIVKALLCVDVCVCACVRACVCFSIHVCTSVRYVCVYLQSCY